MAKVELRMAEPALAGEVDAWLEQASKADASEDGPVSARPLLLAEGAKADVEPG